MRFHPLDPIGRKEPAMSTELLADPPPAAIDPVLLDGAVRYLQRAVHTSGLQLATQVSAYVIDTFFGGDPAGLSSKDPHKTASFAALCAHPDLPMGQATLYGLVRIGLQVRHLPPDLAENLSLSHHRALLTVDNAAHKQHVARLAVEHAWSVAQLRATLAAENPTSGKPRGRRALAPVVKWQAAVQRAVGSTVRPTDFAKQFSKLPAQEQARMRTELVGLRKLLQSLELAIGPG
jgi:hypothetical protein